MRNSGSCSRIGAAFPYRRGGSASLAGGLAFFRLQNTGRNPLELGCRYGCRYLPGVLLPHGGLPEAASCLVLLSGQSTGSVPVLPHSLPLGLVPHPHQPLIQFDSESDLSAAAIPWSALPLPLALLR
jgi:hypothetical protein